MDATSSGSGSGDAPSRWRPVMVRGLSAGLLGLTGLVPYGQLYWRRAGAAGPGKDRKR